MSFPPLDCKANVSLSCHCTFWWWSWDIQIYSFPLSLIRPSPMLLVCTRWPGCCPLEGSLSSLPPSRLPQPARVLPSMMLPSRGFSPRHCPPGAVDNNLASLENLWVPQNQLPTPQTVLEADPQGSMFWELVGKCAPARQLHTHRRVAGRKSRLWVLLLFILKQVYSYGAHCPSFHQLFGILFVDISWKKKHY